MDRATTSCRGNPPSTTAIMLLPNVPLRCFIDTEFTSLEDPELISLALVAEDGREFYAEVAGVQPSQCSAFVREIVSPQLRRWPDRVMAYSQVRAAVLDWIDATPTKSRPLLCYDSDYDWRLLKELIGGALPKKWRHKNIAHALDAQRREAYFEIYGGRHHALHDARANAYALTGSMPVPSW